MVQIQKGLEGNHRAVPSGSALQVSSGSALLRAEDYRRIMRKGSVEHPGLVPGCCPGYAGGV